MAKAYSSDIKKRIIELLEQGWEQNDVAQRLMISQSTVSRTWIQYQRTDPYEALAHSGGRTNKKLFDEHVDAIIDWLEEQPDLFNREIAQMIQETYDIQIAPSLVSIVLRKRGYTRKKIVESSKSPKSRCGHKTNELENHHQNYISQTDDVRLCRLNSHLHRHAKKICQGTKKNPVCVTGRRRHRKHTNIGATGIAGHRASTTVNSSMTTEDMLNFVEQHLLESLNVGEIVVWDNLDIHYNKQANAMIEENGNAL